MNEEIVNFAMEIILNAGDARVHCKNSLNAIAEGNVELANEEIKKANEYIVIAHNIQTDVIQEEVRGKKAEYSLLFAHAQDTLMTIDSEIMLAKQLVKIYEGINQRLENLESQSSKTF